MVEENYESACRLCLNSNSKNINLFENNSYAEIIITISTSLSIQITQNDDFPKCLCTVCIEKIVSWDSFKKLCNESQEQLFQWRERKLQKKRDEESRAISTFSRLETSIHIKEEFIEDDFDDSFEYTYETFTPEFSIKYEPRSDSDKDQQLEKSITPKRTSSPVASSSPRIPFNYNLIIEMYKDNICKFCSKKFNRNSNLIQHLRIFHMSIPMFTCFCCGKTFKTKLEVKTHRTICRRKSLENSSCSIEVTDNSLKDQLNTPEKQLDSVTVADSSEYKFSCSLCGKLFKTIEEWTLHRATHVLKVNDDTSNFDVIDEKILESTNTEPGLDFSDVLNGVKIENVRSESVVTEQVSDIPHIIENFKESVIQPVKKSSRSKRKFSSKSKFSFKQNNYTRNYHCECGKKFITNQGFASHRKYHMRRGEFFPLKSTNKKNKDEVSEVVDDKFKCKGCNKVFLLASKFRFHNKHCPSLKQDLPNETEKITEIKEDKSEISVEQDVIANTDSKKLKKRDGTKCSFCKRKFDNKNRCYKHENQCLHRPTDLKKFIKIHPSAVKCGGCGKCYINKNNYMKHLCRCSNAVLIEPKFEDDEPTSPTNSLLCFLCKRSFLSRGALTEHKKRCYFQRTSSCIECKKVFDSFINFRIHYGQSHDRKSLRHARRLKQMEKPSNHIISGPINNGVTNTWSCKKCRKVFQTLKGYKYHLKNHGNKHTCPNCKKFFYHSKHLTQHLEVCQKMGSENHVDVQNEIPKDPLDITASSPSSSKQIVNIAAPCAVCKMSFTTISELREHILMKHKPAFIQERKKKTYFCQFCKMAFDRHSDLKHHFNEYHADNIKSEYPSPPVLKPELQDVNNPICSLCQLSFDTQDELHEHINNLHNMEM